MSTPISISIPHQLGRIEARRRIETGFVKLIQQLPGGTGTASQRWDGDRLTFHVSGLGQAASGVRSGHEFDHSPVLAGRHALLAGEKAREVSR